MTHKKPSPSVYFTSLCSKLFRVSWSRSGVRAMPRRDPPAAHTAAGRPNGRPIMGTRAIAAVTEALAWSAPLDTGSIPFRLGLFV